MSETERLITAEEFERMPTDERYELVQGRLVPMSPVNIEHGSIVLQVGYLLKHFLRSHPIGTVVCESGFTLARSPDTVRGPDIAFIRNDRMPPPARRRGVPTMAPDAVFEVLSPDDRPRELRAKIAEYLGSSVGLVVIVDPRVHEVVVHRSRTEPVTLGAGSDVLDAGDAIPGFACTVREIFE
jgi:Uma2 family endonuclease